MVIDPLGELFVLNIIKTVSFSEFSISCEIQNASSIPLHKYNGHMRNMTVFHVTENSWEVPTAETFPMLMDTGKLETDLVLAVVRQKASVAIVRQV